MRICILIDAWEPIWGGGQTHVWEMTKHLVNVYKCDVDIFTRALKSQDGKLFIQSETHFQGKLRIFRVGPIAQFHALHARLGWLATVIVVAYAHHRQLYYDVIHAFPFVSGIPGKLLAVLTGLPVVMSVFGTHQMDLGQNIFLARLERFLLTQIKYTVELTDSKHFLRYANANHNIQVIPNGVDVHSLQRLKRRRKNGERNLRLLWIGRFEHVKGGDILLRAFARALKRLPNMHLTIVGYGTEEKKLKDLTLTLNLERNVRFVGKQPLAKLANFYQDTDLFVLPSLAEGQPVTILEAWSAKLPVLTTAVGDIPFLVKDGVTGIVVAPGDVVAMTQGIIKAYTHSNLEALGRRGYELVKSRYTWKKVAKQLFNTYQSVVKSSTVIN